MTKTFEELYNDFQTVRRAIVSKANKSESTDHPSEIARAASAQALSLSSPADLKKRILHSNPRHVEAVKHAKEAVTTSNMAHDAALEGDTANAIKMHQAAVQHHKESAAHHDQAEAYNDEVGASPDHHFYGSSDDTPHGVVHTYAAHNHRKAMRKHNAAIRYLKSNKK